MLPKMTSSSETRLAASFRDPSGYLFLRNGELYRQVNQAYQANYDALLSSGLYARLVKSGALIAHEEVDIEPAEPDVAYRVIKPERLPFISYPYEWCFSQLKDAGLLTLSVLKKALDAGMTLKDASAYNIQFHRGRPVLIDTLSFEVYQEGKPWMAYRQFCQHFLAPLALMAHRDVRLNQLLRNYIDGIPLDLASSLLPLRTRFNAGLAAHIHLHAAAQTRYAGTDVRSKSSARTMGRTAFLGLIENLQSTLRGLKWEPRGTAWGDYYDSTNYSRAAFDDKLAAVTLWAAQCQPELVWDLGANTGVFSRAAAQSSRLTLAWDIDPAAVEKNYREVKKTKETLVLPLLVDLTNPSPGLGWQNTERDSLEDRAPADLVLALALIHHLAIANNVPLADLAAFFKRIGRRLVIEFVPKSDSQVKILLSTRDDIFPHYDEAGFEAAFSRHFTLVEKHPVQDSERTLYLMKAKSE
jgi:ribosomal protein L11 methylase PrmA